MWVQQSSLPLSLYGGGKEGMMEKSKDLTSDPSSGCRSDPESEFRFRIMGSQSLHLVISATFFNSISAGEGRCRPSVQTLHTPSCANTLPTPLRDIRVAKHKQPACSICFHIWHLSLMKHPHLDLLGNLHFKCRVTQEEGKLCSDVEKGETFEEEKFSNFHKNWGWWTGHLSDNFETDCVSC